MSRSPPLDCSTDTECHFSNTAFGSVFAWLFVCVFCLFVVVFVGFFCWGRGGAFLLLFFRYFLLVINSDLSRHCQADDLLQSTLQKNNCRQKTIAYRWCHMCHRNREHTKNKHLTTERNSNADCGWLVSWCFEPSQLRKIIAGLHR